MPARVRDALRQSKRLWRAIREDVGRIRIGLDRVTISRIAVLRRVQIVAKDAAEYPLIALQDHAIAGPIVGVDTGSSRVYQIVDEPILLPVDELNRGNLFDKEVDSRQ